MPAVGPNSAPGPWVGPRSQGQKPQPRRNSPLPAFPSSGPLRSIPKAARPRQKPSHPLHGRGDRAKCSLPWDSRRLPGGSEHRTRPVWGSRIPGDTLPFLGSSSRDSALHPPYRVPTSRSHLLDGSVRSAPAPAPPRPHCGLADPAPLPAIPHLATGPSVHRGLPGALHPRDKHLLTPHCAVPGAARSWHDRATFTFIL